MSGQFEIASFSNLGFYKRLRLTQTRLRRNSRPSCAAVAESAKDDRKVDIVVWSIKRPSRTYGLQRWPEFEKLVSCWAKPYAADPCPRWDDDHIDKSFYVAGNMVWFNASRNWI